MLVMQNALFLLVLLPLMTGCAALKASYHISDASDALNRAEGRQAPELAVYEYTLASRYLAKAKEEAGYSDYRVSVELADLSASWSDRAIIAIGEGRAAPMEPTAAPAAPAPPLRPHSGIVPLPETVPLPEPAANPWGD